MKEKKKQLKKDGKLLDVEEDDPEVVKLLFKAFSCLSKKINLAFLQLFGITDIVSEFLHNFLHHQFKQAVYKQTMKLFAELEIKRKEREAKDMHERYIA